MNPERTLSVLVLMICIHFYDETLALSEKCWHPGHCVGKTTAVKILEHEEECIDFCLEKGIDDCKWVSYVWEARVCHLSKACYLTFQSLLDSRHVKVTCQLPGNAITDFDREWTVTVDWFQNTPDF